jgi:hypothetical protein
MMFYSWHVKISSILIKSRVPKLGQKHLEPSPSIPAAARYQHEGPLKFDLTSIPVSTKSQECVDFFVNTVVFPKELRVFPEKLSVSGWDIGKAKRYPTTVLSGTCDTYPLLLLATEHLSLPRQRHTNALVLKYLLQPDN